jgi:hypothetical protein
MRGLIVDAARWTGLGDGVRAAADDVKNVLPF